MKDIAILAMWGISTIMATYAVARITGEAKKSYREAITEAIKELVDSIKDESPHTDRLSHER